MTVVYIVTLIGLMVFGVFTDADIPQAIDDYAVVILSLAIVTAGFDIGYTIREVVREVAGHKKESATDG